MVDGVEHSNVACTVCGCVCDDLRFTVRGGKIVQHANACSLAEPWYLGHDAKQPPVATVSGRAVELTDAVQRAATLLSDARSPLIYGLSRSSTNGQRAAVHLADTLNAMIDTTASTCHAPSIMAIQQVGESTATLGEIKNRADLVIYWGGDPLTSHPRHLERYSHAPKGLMVPGGKSDRHLVVVDTNVTPTSEIADTFIQVPPVSDYEALNACRLLLAGKEPQHLSQGIDLSALRQLTERMRTCKSGVVFFGLGLARTGLGHRNVEALLRLVAELNAHVPFYARRMRIPGDVTGADTVLCWQTGFPFAVSLNRGYPRYNPNEFSASDLLENEQVDVCLLLGSEGVSELSSKAQAYLDRIPVIAIDHPAVDSPPKTEVRITTGVYGIHYPGTVYRMDEVPLDLTAMLPTHYPSDEVVLQQIHDVCLSTSGV